MDVTFAWHNGKCLERAADDDDGSSIVVIAMTSSTAEAHLNGK